MTRGMKAYLFAEETVVTDKRQIKNAKDEEFREVTLIIPDGTIMQLHHQIMQEVEESRDD